MLRSCLLSAAILATVSLPALAAKPRAASATDVPYVQTSYLAAPRQAGDFVLESTRYQPEAKYSGANFRYALTDHPEIRFDVYVYPAGRMTPAIALTKGMKAFRADLEVAVKHGSYTQLQELESTDFPLPCTSPAAAPTNDMDAAVIAAIANVERLRGHKLRLQMNLQPHDWPMYSSGYLFYKQLYYVKLRVSAAQHKVAADAFNTLADRAALQLVPAVQVTNVGDCANATIYLSADADPASAAVALVQQTATQRGYNCIGADNADEVPAPSQDIEVVKISYTADEWKSQ